MYKLSVDVILPTRYIFLKLKRIDVVFLRNLPFMERHAQFTTVPFKLLSDR